MSQGLSPLAEDTITSALEDHLENRLNAVLAQREAGHCMRVADLDPGLARRLVGRLRASRPDANVVVLAEEEGGPTVPGVVTATKLVELRNPNADGSLRPPLLVFVPNSVHTSAEDSYGVATFEVVSVGGAYQAIRENAFNRLPADLQRSLRIVASVLETERWVWADDHSWVRYLLTIHQNGPSPEVAGASLYELALIPDRELYAGSKSPDSRVRQNIHTVRSLTYDDRPERARVLALPLTDPEYKARLAARLTEVGLENPTRWTRQIVTDRALWPFTFDRWPFEQSTQPTDKVCVEIVGLDLPTMEEGMAEGREDLTGQQVLTIGKQGLTKFGVSFRVDPAPARVQGLSYFRASVHAQDGTPVGLTRRVKVWRTDRHDTRVTFNQLAKVEWDEGWYFVRILAFTEDDEAISLIDRDDNVVDWGGAFQTEGGKRPNDSDLFYVLPGEEADVQPPQRSVPQRPSLFHALIELQAAAITAGRSPDDVRVHALHWSERKRGGTAAAELRFGRDGSVLVPVPEIFRHLQREAVNNSDLPASWHVDVRNGTTGTPTLSPIRLPPDSDGWHRLVEARHEFLAALGESGVIEVAPLSELRPLALDYAEAYTRVVRAVAADDTPQGRRQLTALLSLDTTSLSVSERRGVHRSAILVGPTHPLRALWLVSWAALSEDWIARAANGSPEHVALARRTLLQRLTATGHPLTLPAPDGTLYVAAQDLHPFWSLYASPVEQDPRGLAGSVARAFGLPNAETGMGVDGAFLATRIRHYLRQRPYVRTLAINAFNPGRATTIVAALVDLQRESTYSDLRYDIRLFGPDPTAPAFGDAFNDLLDPGGRTTSEAADAFSSYGGDHRTPKVAVARVPTNQFHEAPERYEANLTFLFDAFPPAPVTSASPPDAEEAPVHGLLAASRTKFVDTGDIVSWTRVVEAGSPTPIPNHPGLAESLMGCARAVAEAAATLAPGNADVPSLRPALVLDLSPTDRALINRVHNVSDWVVTLDRTLGVEFFDHGGFKNRPDFLIDHTLASETAGGRHVIVTSRSNTEALEVIAKALSERGFTTQPPASKAVFNALRALSPQLALKLVANPTQRLEALGLALAKMFLDRKGATAEQITVPLDAHLEIYDEVGEAAQARGVAPSLRRTDLALFDLRPANRLITCNLVEVKAYSRIGDLGAYAALREDVAKQLYQSENALQLHFDPSRSVPDRPDRAFKAHHLRVLLRYYLSRAVRFNALSPTAAKESDTLLARIEDGYRLAFSRSAILFDLKATGFDDAIYEDGVDYFRIGRDVVEELLHDATEATLGELSEEELRAKPLPYLSTAAFLAPPRTGTPGYERSAASIRRDDSPILDDGPPDGSFDSLPVPEASFELPAGDSSEDTALPGPETTLTRQRDKDDALEPANPTGSIPSQAPSTATNAVVGSAEAQPFYDVLLGVQGSSEQYGLLGEISGRKVALDLNHTHTISLFGVQGGGKSYTLGSIIEMATRPIPYINHLPRPLAVVLFHYSPTQDYRPEFTSMVEANAVAREINLLRERYGADPLPLLDVQLLVPPSKVNQRQQEYPNLPVHPLRFAASELQASHWSFLMGIAGNASAYVKQLRLLLRDLRYDLSLPRLRQAIEDSDLPDALKQLARLRLNFAAPFISDGEGIRDLVRPGRLLIVDLRDEFIEQDEALGLFSVLLQLAADADAGEDTPFNKLVVFDEAHKYTRNAELVDGLVGTVREMRHKGTSVLVASQDPPSIPTPLIELSSQIILHKFNSPAWLKHIQKANAALFQLTPEMMTSLGPGEAYVWSSKATDEYVTHHAVKMLCRPRVTQHGGSTRTAI